MPRLDSLALTPTMDASVLPRVPEGTDVEPVTADMMAWVFALPDRLRSLHLVPSFGGRVAFTLDLLGALPACLENLSTVTRCPEPPRAPFPLAHIRRLSVTETGNVGHLIDALLTSPTRDSLEALHIADGDLSLDPATGRSWFEPLPAFVNLVELSVSADRIPPGPEADSFVDTVSRRCRCVVLVGVLPFNFQVFGGSPPPLFFPF